MQPVKMPSSLCCVSYVITAGRCCWFTRIWPKSLPIATTLFCWDRKELSPAARPMNPSRIQLSPNFSLFPVDARDESTRTLYRLHLFASLVGHSHHWHLRWCSGAFGLGATPSAHRRCDCAFQSSWPPRRLPLLQLARI